jgi:small subunit ribosomal protein S6
MTRAYEELFIVKPDAPEEDVKAFIEQIHHVIENGKGKVEKTDDWGTRKLAYRVSKYSEGHYVLIVFSSTPDLVHEVERRMRVTDMVIKFITVRTDEKQKKIDKRKKQREKRAARKPAPVMAAPALPAFPAAPAAAVEHAAPGRPVEGSAPAAPAPAGPAPAAPAAPAPAAPASVAPAAEHAAPAEPVAATQEEK